MRPWNAVGLLAVLASSLLAACGNPSGESGRPQPPLSPIGESPPTLPATPSREQGPAADELGERILGYVRSFANDLGPRDTESGGESRATSHLAEEFRNAGLQVIRQEFAVTMYETRTPRLVVLGDEPGPLSAEPLRSSAEGAVQGPLVFVGLGYPENFPAGGLQGKIALIERGQIRFQEKVGNAARAGASAVVIFNNASGPLFGTLLDSSIPAVGIRRADGLALKERLASGELQVRVAVRQVRTLSQNIIVNSPAPARAA